MTALDADHLGMTVHDVRHESHSGSTTPAWSTVAACVSLGLLVLAGLAGAVGLG
ncbi:MAG: hypothetical protein H7269_01425 [Cellulomonas sp.]|nr:hypothetical protein [Cellulomonas sp.]